MSRLHIQAVAAAGLALLSLAVVSPRPAVSATSAGGSAFAPAPVKETAPFARVYLAIRGCTSCSHCRTTIRQMVRSSAQGGEARLRDDRVEVRYAAPQSIPLQDVIQSLAANRLHDLSLVDVLFEARGTLSTGKDGTATFTIQGTGQSFPATIDPSVASGPAGRPVRLVAVVDGWRAKGALNLHVREIRSET